MEDLASAVIEENLRASLSAPRFRTEQRKRAIMLLEYLRRMGYDSWVILAWAYQLQDRSQSLVPANGSLSVAIADALAAAIPFRLYSLMVLPRAGVANPAGPIANCPASHSCCCGAGEKPHHGRDVRPADQHRHPARGI